MNHVEVAFNPPGIAVRVRCFEEDSETDLVTVRDELLIGPEPTPETVNRFVRGVMPAGVTLPSASVTVSLSPTPTSRALASSTPRMILNLPGARSARSPLVITVAIPETDASRSGSIPRSSAPLRRSPNTSSAWPLT